MAGQVGEFRRGAQETAALPAGTFGPRGQLFEDRGDAIGHVTPRFGEPPAVGIEIGLVAVVEIGGDQIILALEMVIERTLGDTRLLRDRIDADGADALAIEQAVGRFDDALASGDFGLGHAPKVY